MRSNYGTRRNATITVRPGCRGTPYLSVKTGNYSLRNAKDLAALQDLINRLQNIHSWQKKIHAHRKRQSSAPSSS